MIDTLPVPTIAIPSIGIPSVDIPSLIAPLQSLIPLAPIPGMSTQISSMAQGLAQNIPRILDTVLQGAAGTAILSDLINASQNLDSLLGTGTALDSITAQAQELFSQAQTDILAIIEQCTQDCFSILSQGFQDPRSLFSMLSSPLTIETTVMGFMEQIHQRLQSLDIDLEPLIASIQGILADMPAPMEPPSPYFGEESPKNSSTAPLSSDISSSSFSPDSTPPSSTSAPDPAAAPSSTSTLTSSSLENTSAPRKEKVEKIESTPRPHVSSGDAPTPQAAAAVAAAHRALGTPYQWGGTTPGVGMDCSGFTQWAYKEAGVDIPRTAEAQAVGTRVSRDELRPGDLAVWDGHVAMIVDSNTMIEAGDPVQKSSIRTENIGMNFKGFYRPTA